MSRNPATEASDMLAAALEQMDGILAGWKGSRREYTGQNGVHTPGSASPDSPRIRLRMQSARASNLLEELQSVLADQAEDNKRKVFQQLPYDLQDFLKQWVVRDKQQYHQVCMENWKAVPRPIMDANNCPSTPDSLEENVRKLETDRESLMLQVSVLTDQVEAQGDKIRDLESSIVDPGGKFTKGAKNAANQHVSSSYRLPPDECDSSGELISRTTLETHKLDLMAEISNLKLKLATSEKDRREAEERLTHAQKRIDELQARLNERTIEVTDLRTRLTKNGTLQGSHTEPPVRKRHVSESDKGGDAVVRTLEREKTLDRLKRKHSEVEKLKKAVEALMQTNSEKDHHIEEQRKMIKKYQRIEELVLATHGRKGLEQLGLPDDAGSDSSSTHNSSSSNENNGHHDGFDMIDRKMPIPSATSTPGKDGQKFQGSNGIHHPDVLTPPSRIMNLHSPSPRTASTGLVRSNSAEDLSPLPSKTPPTVRRHGTGYGTLPATLSLAASSGTGSHSSPGTVPRAASTSTIATRPPTGVVARKPPPHQSSPTRARSSPANKHQASTMPAKNRGFPSFGKGFFKLRSGKWSSSAPNLGDEDPSLFQPAVGSRLAQNTDSDETLKDEMAQQYKMMQAQSKNPNAPPVAWDQKKKQKGIKRFFGKLRRSSSQDMDGELEDFRRNGLRATAGPRLGWSKDLKYNDLDVPFARWDSDRVAAWLHSMGLSMYVGECKRWIKNGDHLLKASSHDLEKELGMRNTLHRKKLQLALESMGGSNARVDARGRVDELDHNWVLRWLDDIGLPQYKDHFNEAKVDGRLLHYLTVEELLYLKVTNALHHLSIKRSIQVLRKNNWNPGCLKRRPTASDTAVGPLRNAANEVMLWTNHRVMEWLRTIDLSEYAPNLRGSGVHGALMVLEPRFTAELFASLLSIPTNKTLLRRHLSTHFVALIGNEMQHRKREVEAQPGYIPLTPNQKLKVFTNIPVQIPSQVAQIVVPVQKLKKFGLFGHRRTRSDPDLDDFVCPMGSEPTASTNGWTPGDKVKDEKAAKEIGAYSQEINTLTTMLAKDKFLDDVPTSDV